MVCFSSFGIRRFLFSLSSWRFIKNFPRFFLGKKYVFSTSLFSTLVWNGPPRLRSFAAAFRCCAYDVKLINSFIKAILLELSRCLLKSIKFFYARVICFTLEFVIVSPANLFHKIPKSGVQGLVRDCVMILRILKFIGIRLILYFARRINKLVIWYMASLKAQSIC